jgi:predicted nucleotide-binding protein (sugar kinase/HSP70/actin superfamily)
MQDRRDGELEKGIGLTDASELDLGATLSELGLDEDLAAQLAELENGERVKLGLQDDAQQWMDPQHSTFTAAQRPHTTILVSGLTMAHDLFVQSGLRGIGYKVQALDCPDNDALRYGKEFGNRGQCNPTYFTVGNLIKHLTRMRDEEGRSTEEIIENTVFITAGACGPCRFGTYVTEYRKALRDSGFDGFRVLLFQQTGGLKQATGEELGLQLDRPFFVAVVKALVIGDVLNALAYRIRPYELTAGETDEAIEACKADVADAMQKRKPLVPVLYKCRRRLAAVEVDKTRVRPKVAIIGEFWAMTTEGDGNYKLQRFLEQEGADVDVQPVTAWLLYLIWEGRWDTKKRMDLRGADGGRRGLEGVDVRKRFALLWAADKAVRVIFQSVANLMGLHHFPLPDMEEVAEVAHKHYDNMLRGGEGHMEVGKLIVNVLHSKVNMTISVKPFGCMPSSSVSDGVQSLITELFPQAIFLPIETSGDGAVNVYSRIQMQLFRARKLAQSELSEALEKTGMSAEQFQARVQKSRKLNNALHQSPHRAGCTAADLVWEAAGKRSPLSSWHETVSRAIKERVASFI